MSFVCYRRGRSFALFIPHNSVHPESSLKYYRLLLGSSFIQETPDQVGTDCGEIADHEGGITGRG